MIGWKHNVSHILQVLDQWFETLRGFLQEVDLLERPDLSSHLWNADETDFCTAVASSKVLAVRGAKDVHETAGGSGCDYITVLGAGAADGVRLPPYIIYKGEISMQGGQRVDQQALNMGLAKVDGWRVIIFLIGLVQHSYEHAHNWSCCSICRWPLFPFVPFPHKIGTRERCPHLLLTTPHNAYTATTGCSSIWSSQTVLEKKLKEYKITTLASKRFFQVRLKQ